MTKVRARRAGARRVLHFVLRQFARTSSGRTLIFSAFAALNRWGSTESRSGSGSTLDQTASIRAELPRLVREHSIVRLLDIPCGDGHWVREADLGLEEYIGADIAPVLVRRLSRSAKPHERFLRLDLVSDALPRADAVLCRDALVHMSLEQALAALENIRRSGARVLIATTFPGRVNAEVATGGWRPLDLSAPPFDLGPPDELIDERCTEADGQYSDKGLGVWLLREV